MEYRTFGPEPDGNAEVAELIVQDHRGAEGDGPSSIIGEYTEIEVKLLHMLTTLFKAASNLEELSIEFCEDLLELDQYSELQEYGFRTELATAISLSRSLQRLSLSSLGLRTQCLLHELLATLVEVNIDFEHNATGNEDLLAALSAHRDTLETITAIHVAVNGRAPTQPTPVFPRVRSLSLWHITDLSLESLLVGFPNLRELSLGAVALGRDHAFTVSTNWATPDSEHWSLLTILRGDVAALDALGLTRSVRTLEVARGTLHPADCAMLHDVLSGVTPERLLLHVGHYYDRALLPSAGVSYEMFVELLNVLDPLWITHFALDACIPLFASVIAGCVSLLVSPGA